MHFISVDFPAPFGPMPCRAVGRRAKEAVAGDPAAHLTLGAAVQAAHRERR